MKFLKIAGASLNQTPLDWPGNEARIARALQQARQQEVQLLCLPELCISGYGCEDAFAHSHITTYSLQALQRLLPLTQGMVVAIGLPLALNGSLYNCAALCTDGRLLGLYAKHHLAGDGIHYEPRWFKGWEGPMQYHHLPVLNVTVPVGPIVMEVDGVRIGFEICEDAWTGHRTGHTAWLHGADIILNPSASHFALGKTYTRRRIVVEGSRAFQCAYIMANLVGNEAGRAIYDGEILIAQNGQLLAANPLLRYPEVQLCATVVDVEATRHARQRLQTYPAGSVELPLVADTDLTLTTTDPQAATLPADPEDKPTQLYRALTLGLWDYMRKSRSRGFVVSLSGGADSGACALLAARALYEARTQLGEEEALRLSHLTTLDTGRLLTCVYQATQNSSADTLQSAKSIATGLGATWYVWDVQPLLDQYRGMAEGSLGRPLSWEQDDLALQNIQARLRAPGVWLLANVQGGLLLTTSNRSEGAVGYATMDGDTSGGLAPIGGLDKAYLREWLRWAEQALDMPWLAPLNALTPTAELRPAERHQTDEADLMPYPLLDAIERLAIGHGHTPLEIYTLLKETGWTEAQLRTGIVRFFRLWARNQWKRERYAPSFHLDDHNLDPRSWYRFPILSGGWEKELAELEATE